VILPCLNESAALPSVLESIDDRYRVLVVDNGSEDDTPEIARRHGATVISCGSRGYGAACHAGLEAADADVVAVMDADDSLDGGQLRLVVEPILAGTRDLMIGARAPVVRRAWTWWQRLANRELARQLRRRTGVPLSDLGPMRAARRTALLDLGLQDRRSGYPAETVVLAADAGWRIGQVPVDYRPRIGRSKVTGTPVGALRAVRDMRRAIRSLPSGEMPPPTPVAAPDSSRPGR
jgi:glycosyltransferase involved in cell wall biosynthesis